MSVGSGALPPRPRATGRSRASPAAPGTCGCRLSHPCRSCGMLVFVEYSAESVSSADVELVESVWFGERFGGRPEGITPDPESTVDEAESAPTPPTTGKGT